MLKDLFSAVQKSLSDRVRDPFLGSYTGFFLLWNWKPVALLLFGSAGGFEDRLAYVTEVLRFPKADLCGGDFPYGACAWNGGGLTVSIGWNYGIPLLFTAAYLLWYPSLKRRLVSYVQERETEVINAKREKEKSIALTPAMSARLQSNLDRLQTALEKSNKERFELPLLIELARGGAAWQANGEPRDFVAAFASAADKNSIRAGHWMVLDPEKSEVFYFGGRWHPSWRVCMVTHLLDGLMVLVRVRGVVQWENWSGMWNNMVLTPTRPYILSEETKGAIRQGRDEDRGIDIEALMHELGQRVGKAKEKKDEGFSGFVGYASIDGSSIQIANKDMENSLQGLLKKAMKKQS